MVHVFSTHVLAKKPGPLHYFKMCFHVKVLTLVTLFDKFSF